MVKRVKNNNNNGMRMTYFLICIIANIVLKYILSASYEMFIVLKLCDQDRYTYITEKKAT